MDRFIIEGAITERLQEELKEIARIVGSDTNDPRFEKLHEDIKKFVYDRIEIYHTLSKILYTVYDADKEDVEHPIKRDYAVGKKADDILKRLKEIRDYMNSHKNIKIRDSYFDEPLTLPIENIQQVLELYKLIADLFDKMYLNYPESLTRKNLLDITEKMKNWKYRDFNDIFKPAEPTKTENESSSLLKTILIIAGAVIAIVSFILILSNLFSKN